MILFIYVCGVQFKRCMLVLCGSLRKYFLFNGIFLLIAQVELRIVQKNVLKKAGVK